MLVGNQTPYRARYTPTTADRLKFDQRRARFIKAARSGIGVKEMLAYIRHPGWQWHSDDPSSRAVL